MKFHTDMRSAKELLSQRYDPEMITVSSLCWDNDTWSITAFHTVTTDLSWDYVRESVRIKHTDDGTTVTHFVEVARNRNRDSITFTLNKVINPDNIMHIDWFDGMSVGKPVDKS